MQSAAPTPDEAQRIAKLESYRVLDTPPEPSFDDITALASQIGKAPIALVSLVDTDRQWFKSKVGLDVDETPRDVSFCAHAIHGDELFEVPDARQDERFSDNPLVTGGPRIGFYAGAPITTPEGHNVGTLCVIDRQPRALTAEQKEGLIRLSRLVASELEYRLLAERANRAAAAKSRLLANTSHELRTPLNAIIGYTELLIEDADDAIREDLGKVRNSAEYLLTLIDGLLDLSKIEAGDVEVRKGLVTLRMLAAEIENLALPMVEVHGNRLIIDTSEAPETVTTDYRKLKQVLVNLLCNAAKFTERGTVTVRFTREATSGGEEFVAEVADDGIGIDADKLESIFEIFSQAGGSAGRHLEGPGLGLSICRRFAELLDGELSVRSRPGEGSVFTLRIPTSPALSLKR